METLEYIRRLFVYDHWANREVVTALQQVPSLPPQSLTRLAHVVSAQKLWLERLQSQKQSQAVWPEFNLERCKVEIEDLAGGWKAYLNSLTEDRLSQVITYKNTKGESWSSHTRDILMHVILHSAYHRGQVATDMRAAGFAPANTDFIHAVRQGLVE